MKPSNIAVMLAMKACALWSATAAAQASCPEGRTSAGQCVSAPLAARARLVAIIHAQPKISLTAYPVLPAGDILFRYPHELISGPLGPSLTGTPLPPPPPPD